MYVDLMNGVIVIVCISAETRQSREREFADRPIIMRARDGTIIEVSEWKSQEAIDAAHKNPNVLAMWNKFFAMCDCVPLKTLAEAEEMFAGFEPYPAPLKCRDAVHVVCLLACSPVSWSVIAKRNISNFCSVPAISEELMQRSSLCSE